MIRESPHGSMAAGRLGFFCRWGMWDWFRQPEQGASRPVRPAQKDDGSKTTQSFPSRLVRIRASVNCAVSCMHEMRNRGTSASLLRLHDPRAESRLCSSLLGGCTETKRHIPVSNPHDRHAQLSGCWGA